MGVPVLLAMGVPILLAMGVPVLLAMGVLVLLAVQPSTVMYLHKAAPLLKQERGFPTIPAHLVEYTVQS